MLRPPVFILGVPRSGTTLLRVILDCHSRISAPPETPWILGSHGPEESFRKLYHVLVTDEHGPCKTMEGVHGNDILIIMKESINKILSKHIQAKNKEYLVLKTPDDLEYLEDLKHFFPGSKFIHIVRDGRDVACSTVKSIKRNEFNYGYGKVNYYNSIRRWYLWEKKIQELVNNKNDVHLLRYEDLIANPGKEISKITDFLGVEFEEEMINYTNFNHHYPSYEKGSTDVKNYDAVIPSNLNNWVDEIPEDIHIKAYEDFQDIFETYGYSYTKSNVTSMEVYKRSRLRLVSRSLNNFGNYAIKLSKRIHF